MTRLTPKLHSLTTLVSQIFKMQYLHKQISNGSIAFKLYTEVKYLNLHTTRQSEMADLARRATRDLSQFHMGGPNFDTGRSWKL